MEKFIFKFIVYICNFAFIWIFQYLYFEAVLIVIDGNCFVDKLKNPHMRKNSAEVEKSACWKRAFITKQAKYKKP